VSPYPDNEPKTRRERLAAIAEEHTEEIQAPRTREQLSGPDPVFRYATVTSEGPRETDFSTNANLIVAETTVELAELLCRECEEGWLPYWRVWDLDAPWDLWGNLEIAYRVEVGQDVSRPVHLVRVEGREDGIYLFDDLLDAETFARAVGRHGGVAAVSAATVMDHRAADQLIDAERGRH
jgi:hypothetical protein